MYRRINKKTIRNKTACLAALNLHGWAVSDNGQAGHWKEGPVGSWAGAQILRVYFHPFCFCLWLSAGVYSPGAWILPSLQWRPWRSLCFIRKLRGPNKIEQAQCSALVSAQKMATDDFIDLTSLPAALGILDASCLPTLSSTVLGR